MKYYLIAGEASGDLQAAYLIKELAIADTTAQFRCFGGELMEKQGAVVVKHYRELAFMGVEQVLLNIRTIFQNMVFCKQDILNFNPDVLILVDYPGFNLKIARWAKANNMKTYYYISPKIWAWNQKRVFKIKKIIDQMFVILPFEKDFYAKFNYPVDFVGHPLLDCIADRPQISFADFCKAHQLNNKPIIALLPGSRKQEISSMLAIMLSVVDNFPDYQFVIAGAPSQQLDFYQQFINKDVAIIENKTYDLLQHASAALVVSGTATLETALFKVPQVVCYKTGWLFYKLAKMVVKIKYISLVNLIVDKKIVTELIQSDLTTTNLIKELTKITTHPDRENQLIEYENLHLKLGGKGASKKAAELIVGYLTN
ncbi:MAG: lipid-A-disaccharide synthase [Flavobacteriales bacterium CG_4_10_14_0_2_um_filter_32_8]|nr:MAG: lipid-A-disaccharide synthase [Flavobacteriales bacterium CG_4_10_14_0_2_um_filter_32_8]PJB14183.1 MAG: lipid-A-disaccharide synthase [Flavobacteriales bacterium CG_4_9_14_3_um_filter_32_8]